MKKKMIVTISLVIVLIIGLTGCACSNPSLVSVQGVFYGDCGGAQNGYKDLYVVFDYKNDNTNRKMPEATSEVSISINGDNNYTISENTMHKYTNSYGSFSMPDYGWLERYTGYKYVLGYGDLLGGNPPVRMFAHFDVNENDFNNASSITFKVGDQVATYPVSDVKQIKYADEIMRVEGNFEKAQILAAEKWRLDTAYRTANFAMNSGHGGYGDRHSGMSQSMKSLFSPESGGLSVNNEPASGFNQSTHTYNKVIEDLPAYNHETVVEGYPEVAKNIETAENIYSQISDAIVNPSTSSQQMIDLMNQFLEQYSQICSAWGLEMGPK